MNIRYIILVAFMLAAFVICVQGKKGKDGRKLVNKITKGMGKRDRRLIKKYCKNATLVPMRESSRARNDLGFARWRNAVLKCTNIGEEVIHTVLCDKYCVDPVTCEKMDKKSYCNKPVHIDVKMSIRDGTTKAMKIPVACQCVKCTRKNNTDRKKTKAA